MDGIRKEVESATNAVGGGTNAGDGGSNGSGSAAMRAVVFVSAGGREGKGAFLRRLPPTYLDVHKVVDP